MGFRPFFFGVSTALCKSVIPQRTNLATLKFTCTPNTLIPNPNTFCYSSIVMQFSCNRHPRRKAFRRSSLLLSLLCVPANLAVSQETHAVPDWAWPGSATHKQIPPPADFHRPSRNFNTPIGLFEGQSDIGAALVPGSASYDAVTQQYTINSAGYNVWYSRDEFRYLWKKMSGDFSLAADATFPDPNGYGDRKALLVIRQTLDDDSKEAMVAEHGTGMIHLAQRSERDALITDMQYRFGGALSKIMTKRIGLEKHGDSIAIFISLAGEPMHQFGPPITLHFDSPFYVGIGFCSHLPDKSDTAVLSNVILENSAGKVH